MAKLSRDLATPLGGSSTLHPREGLFVTGTIGALNAEVITACDGSGSVSLDMRGTASLTVEVSGTVDGTNWTPIPMRPVNVASVLYVAAVAFPAGGGLWVGSCAGFRTVRARCTVYTSGSATTTLLASSSLLDQSLLGQITPNLGTVTAASGSIATLTLAAPGAGLRHYVTYVSITRYAAAVLTASAPPVIVTTTNLPGTLAFTIPADAATLGTVDRYREDFSFPLASSAQNAATTIVGPATTGVIWRITAGFYVAP
jgi:hypothetical protein